MSNIMIAGSDWPIEAKYHESSTSGAPVVIIAPPHPTQEGLMNHKVTYTMFRAFASLKFNVLRFNYRGCGKSPGVFSDGENEVADIAACLDWLLGENLSPPQLWVAGFSFGSWIGMQLLMRRPEFAYFVSISPPANIYDFSFLAPCPTSGLFIHGECDEVVPREVVTRLAYGLSMQRRRNKIEFHTIKNANHNFDGNEGDLEDTIISYVAGKMDEAQAAALAKAG